MQCLPFFVLLLDPANTGGLARRCCTSILSLHTFRSSFTHHASPQSLHGNTVGLFRRPAPTSELFGTLLAFFAAKHLPSEPSGDTFALFCRPKPHFRTLRRHFCPFLPPETSRRNPQATLLPFFAARNLTSEPFSDTLDHFCHLASMQPIFPDSAVSSSIAPKTVFTR